MNEDEKTNSNLLVMKKKWTNGCYYVYFFDSNERIWWNFSNFLKCKNHIFENLKLKFEAFHTLFLAGLTCVQYAHNTHLEQEARTFSRIKIVYKLKWWKCVNGKSS